MISLKNITHFFNDFKALDDISFDVKEGQVLGLIGENGAGKTTLMRIIAGFLKQSVGEVKIFDKDFYNDSYELKQKIGYMPEGAPLYHDMSVISFLKFIAEAKKINKKLIPTEIDRVVEIAGLKNVLKSDIGILSKGYKRRVSLASAIISDPAVLLLDEPAEGLDPNQKQDFKQRLKEMNKITIISSHVLEDVKEFSTDIALIHKGCLKFKASLKEIANQDLNQIFRKYTKDESNN
ncbi:MAG: putative ABC transporter ATP-binding protein YbhF [Alphaproteobacteria bacterium ADurb.Bin438]|nr:MAG: putative ABC transporter ATP-binding protein YbhF [Alphaproteobacteria bacterium ADurb.Bin438]